MRFLGRTLSASLAASAVFSIARMPKRRRVFEPKIDRTPPNLQKLVRLIFSEAFLPGDRLVERDLAEKLKLNIQRYPVAKAKGTAKKYDRLD